MKERKKERKKDPHPYIFVVRRGYFYPVTLSNLAKQLNSDGHFE